MQWYWTWSGKSFGYRNYDDLYTHDGKHVGKFYDNDIYDSNGSYLGEVKNKMWLIVNKGKKFCKKSPFVPCHTGGYVRYVNYVGNVMYVGYEDFPAPESFSREFYV